MTPGDVLLALRELGEGDHRTMDIWWPLRDHGSRGQVERHLSDLWERGLVLEPRPGWWRLPVEKQMELAA